MICVECSTGFCSQCLGCDCVCNIPEELDKWIDDYEPECCPHCGKEYEDFSDIGCGACDQRSPEWGTR
jgi:hypothetical protein